MRECKEFAEKQNIDILGTYIDRAMSAKTDNRPEFQRMIKDSGKYLFERVQTRMAKNKKAPARRKSEDDYLLTYDKTDLEQLLSRGAMIFYERSWYL